jgi:ketosteroid isomerase-like protein
MSRPPRRDRPAAPGEEKNPENDARVERVRVFFETITPASAARIDTLYTADAYFKDPFNEVRGAASIRRIFEHMFVQVEAPRFVIRDTVAQRDDAFLTWDFLFRIRRRGGEQVVRGASHLKFAADGRVQFHRDYWDVAEELYEKLPVLGGLMRLLKKRAAG